MSQETSAPEILYNIPQKVEMKGEIAHLFHFTETFQRKKRCSLKVNSEASCAELPKKMSLSQKPVTQYHSL